MAIQIRERRIKELRLEELHEMLASAEALQDPKNYANLSREYKKLEQLVQKYQEYDKIEEEIQAEEFKDIKEELEKDINENEEGEEIS